MKILITETQYSVLFEQNNSKILQAYNDIVAGAKYYLGTDKGRILKAFDYIQNIDEFKKLLSMFKDKRTGYSSFEEMINKEYDRSDYNDIIKLKEKLYSIGVILSFQMYQNMFDHNFFDGNVKLTRVVPKVVPKIDDSCKSRYSPLLEKAKDWWIKWLSDPITKRKFRENWNVQPTNDTVDGKKIDDIFKEYINRLNNLKLIFYTNDMVIIPGFNLEVETNAFAFVHPHAGNNIFVNCSLNNEQPLETLIHEIQHLLYYTKPLNPNYKVSRAFVKPNDKILVPKSNDIEDFVSTYFLDPLVSKDKNIIIDLNKVSSSLGVDYSALAEWKKWAEKEASSKSDNPDYICRETEKLSNIQSIRKLFNLKPGQNITFNMLKPYINMEKTNNNIDWFLGCWALKGFKDINLFLSEINKLAYQEPNQTDNSRQTDYNKQTNNIKLS